MQPRPTSNEQRTTNLDKNGIVRYKGYFGRSRQRDHRKGRQDLHCWPQWYGWFSHRSAFAARWLYPLDNPRPAGLDLFEQRAVFDFLEAEKPEYIFMAAARVGAINANSIYRPDVIYQNLAIQNNVVHGAHLAGVKDLCFLGSSCIYPRASSQSRKTTSSPVRSSRSMNPTLLPRSPASSSAKVTIGNTVRVLSA